jgi:hypothetical protein
MRRLAVRASVIRLNADRTAAEARTANDILIAFSCPPGSVSLSDLLELDLNVLDTRQDVLNLTTAGRFPLTIETHNVHDLRLPDGHGTSRFPSLARRLGA